MKKLFILFSVFLVFLSLAVPCFATNEGLYGHYVSPGTYRFDDELSNYGYIINIPFDFRSVPTDGYNYTGLVFDGTMIYYWGGTASNNIGPVYSDNTWNPSYQVIVVDEPFYIYDSSAYSWWLANTTVEGEYNGHLIDGILSVFAGIGSWLGNAFSSLQAIFFVDGALTLVGTLSVLGLAFAIILLLFNMLRSFIKFR